MGMREPAGGKDHGFYSLIDVYLDSPTLWGWKTRIYRRYHLSAVVLSHIFF